MAQIVDDNFPLQEFTYRNDGSFKLPLDVIISSFYMSVDIIVESVDYPQYKNYKVLPERSFYGYVELVENNTLLPPIEVVQPRQRIWEKWNWEALRVWYELHEYYESQYKYNREILVQVEGGAGEEVPHYVRDPSDWTPLELREVYARCLPNTQFRLVFNNISPIFFTDPSGILRNGKSNRTIPDENRGLPKNGIQPKKNPHSSPFAGNNPLNVPSGTSPWFLDPSNLGKVDPNNGTDTTGGTPDPTVFWIESVLNATSSGLGCANRVQHQFHAIEEGTLIGDILDVPPKNANGCGGLNYNLAVYDTSGALLFETGTTTNGSAAFRYGSGTSLPVDYIE